MEFRARPLLKGTLSFVVPALRSAHRADVIGTASAVVCYAIFLRHFSRLARFTGGRLPSVVAELGPGNSLGTGLAAVIAGADRTIGLDLQDHTDRDLNLQVFDALVTLFRDRAPVPRDVLIATPPLDWAFPPALLAGLPCALDDDRLSRIRRDIVEQTGRYVGFAAPWNERACVQAGSVDWILSHSVMEHVDDVAGTYRAASRWLAPGGWMTHEIDYSSHGLTRHWNGHWAVDEAIWRLIRGRRPFLINRLPHGAQIARLAAARFEVLEELRVSRADGLSPGRFAGAYGSVGGEDARTHIAFLVCRAPSPEPPGQASDA